MDKRACSHGSWLLLPSSDSTPPPASCSLPPAIHLTDHTFWSQVQVLHQVYYSHWFGCWFQITHEVFAAMKKNDQRSKEAHIHMRSWPKMMSFCDLYIHKLWLFLGKISESVFKSVMCVTQGLTSQNCVPFCNVGWACKSCGKSL